MNLKNAIIRHSKPSLLDQNAYATVCKVQDHNINEYMVYIQASKNENHPQWEFIGLFNAQSAVEYVDELISMRLTKNIHTH